MKLLDLSRQLPEPFASMILADLGVDVLVIAAPNDVMGVGIPLIQRNRRNLTLIVDVPMNVASLPAATGHGYLTLDTAPRARGLTG